MNAVMASGEAKSESGGKYATEMQDERRE